MDGCSAVKIFQTQQRDEGFLLLTFWNHRVGKLGLSPITHCHLKLWSKHTYSEAPEWLEGRASTRGCGEMKRSKESEARFVPLCHYPHFLATAGQLPCNEGQFQGFSTWNTHTKLWSKYPYTEIPLSLNLGLYIITTSPALCITVMKKTSICSPWLIMMFTVTEPLLPLSHTQTSTNRLICFGWFYVLLV